MDSGITPFSGLGLGLEAVRCRAARIIRAVARRLAAGLLAPSLPAPPKPWGIELLVTLRRLTRAG